MSRPIAFVDLDSTVDDTLPAWLQRIYEKTGIRAGVSDIVNWNIATCSVFRYVDPQTIYDIVDEPGFTASLPLLKGAQTCLYKMQNDLEWDVYFVTARYGRSSMPETLWRMKRYFPWLDAEKRLCFLHDKSMLRGDLLIDDKMDNLVAYRNAHPAAALITIDYPYNRFRDFDGLHRVAYDEKAWDHIYQIVKKINLER